MFYGLRGPERTYAQNIRLVKIAVDTIGGWCVSALKYQCIAIRHSDTFFNFTVVSASIVGWNAPTALKLSLYTQRGRLKRYRMRNPVLTVGFGIPVDGVSVFLNMT